ncbi:hypothetical protein C5E45_28310 [Nocardia nova]|uniref:Uncharacterized protein n=1 Tax=Nocardia nova TaxID=37330 RepID=A0A2S6AI77_9NOCA|nr:hypothetical protein [Nocardia nova]PPJ24152.1 hypothetical protein C5E41_22900 [Nocardia nova]PPJ34922.1 hypothetical protein C5E45_28310 [Nocardia nova]
MSVSNPARFDGLSCTECGGNLATPGARSVPVGFGPDGQTFRCAPGTGCSALATTPAGRYLATLRPGAPIAYVEDGTDRVLTALFSCLRDDHNALVANDGKVFEILTDDIVLPEEFRPATLLDIVLLRRTEFPDVEWGSVIGDLESFAAEPRERLLDLARAMFEEQRAAGETR